MAVAGRKPKDAHRHKVKPTHDWVEIENRPFVGAPELPERGWHIDTLDWWDVISTMPHCILWTRSDWRFALDTARVAASFHAGNMNQAVELRQREKLMGVTLDARRDLRIRYVEATEEMKPRAVTAISEYKERLAKAK